MGEILRRVSREYVEIVRRTYGEWAQGNMRAGVELFDPEIAFETFMPDADQRVVARGPAEIAGFMREFLRQWRDYRLLAEEFVDHGETVLVIGHQSAFGRQSGIAVDYPMCSAWTFRRGKVVRLAFDPDPQRALAAAQPK